MNYILSIESALDVCSVALSNDGEILALKEEKGFNIHSASLTLFIEEVLKNQNIRPTQLSAIAVSMGPGSYTGLRIGVSVAKGLAFSLDKPLISVNTLQSLCIGALEHRSDADALLYPLIDARRMEVYWACYDRSLNEIHKSSASVIDEKFIQTLPRDKPIYFFGNGMDKCRELLSTLNNALFIENIEPSAKFIAQLATDKFNHSEFENVSSFEPFYLKDFFTTAKV